MGDTSGISGLSPCPKLFRTAVLAVTLLTIINIAAVWWVQEQDLRTDAGLRIYFLRHHLKDEIKDEVEVMDALLGMVSGKKQVQKAWQSRDRGLLMEAAGPIFQSICRHKKISHFYFIDTDRTCFLRVHNPASHGDRIGRLTLDVAVHTQKKSSGVEIGPFGTLAVRVVRPWFIDGELAGYLELGEEIDTIFRDIAKLVSADLLLAVEKKTLEKKSWEQGLAMTGKTGNWELFRDVVLSSSTLEGVGRELEPYLKPDGQDRSQFSLQHRGKSYRGGYDHLVDISGTPVGRYLILCDVTGRKEQNLVTRLAIGFLSVAVGGAFLLLLRRAAATSALSSPSGEPCRRPPSDDRC